MKIITWMSHYFNLIGIINGQGLESVQFQNLTKNLGYSLKILGRLLKYKEK